MVDVRLLDAHRCCSHHRQPGPDPSDGPTGRRGGGRLRSGSWLRLLPFEVRFAADEDLGCVVEVADETWARFDAAAGTVVQGGARLLWAVIEDADRVWSEPGQPARDRFGLSVTGDRRQRAWPEEATSANTWELLPAGRDAGWSSGRTDALFPVVRRLHELRDG